MIENLWGLILSFLGDIEMEHWLEMSLLKNTIIIKGINFKSTFLLKTYFRFKSKTIKTMVIIIFDFSSPSLI